eukprot:GHVL01003480.1.p1 GENE.GHVL01003480.1~~GHVL01003480.1.p1  ORF type:complete len:331 (-),score=43.21 GHVL01003480.1:679-1671(-)
MAIRRERTKIRQHPTLGLQLNKKTGQHLLKNTGILDKIINAAEIKSSDTVFEIGPGTGNLTIRLLPISGKVIACDIDRRMVTEVKRRALSLGYSNLDVREADVLHSAFPRFDVCVANLPYQISSPFVFKLIAHRPLFRCAVLMFQFEFAERLLAQPGEACYGRLAINTQLFVKIARVCKVSAGSFNPPPKVDSMVVKLTPKKNQTDIDFREWDGMLRICFGRKRKLLRANFNCDSVLRILETNYNVWCSLMKQPKSTDTVKDLVFAALNDVDVAAKRAVEINTDTYFRLLLAFNQRGIHFVNTNTTTTCSPANDMMEIADSLFEDDESMS